MNDGTGSLTQAASAVPAPSPAAFNVVLIAVTAKLGKHRHVTHGSLHEANRSLSPFLARRSGSFFVIAMRRSKDQTTATDR